MMTLEPDIRRWPHLGREREERKGSVTSWGEVEEVWPTIFVLSFCLTRAHIFCFIFLMLLLVPRQWHVWRGPNQMSHVDVTSNETAIQIALGYWLYWF